MTKRNLFFLFALFAATPAFPHAHPPAIDENDPDAWKIKLCNRISDVALQALADRDKGRPMKLYEEDGDEARLANQVTRRIFAEPQVTSPKKAMVFGRGACNEYLEKR